MKYELIMLRYANKIKYCDKCISCEIRQIALTSYSVLNFRDGTMGQMSLISELAGLRDKCRLFWQSLVEGLKAIDKPYRALLVAVYLKNADISVMCAKYRTSKSTFYRRLWRARALLRQALARQGYDEQWFDCNFGDLDIVSEMNQK